MKVHRLALKVALAVAGAAAGLAVGVYLAGGAWMWMLLAVAVLGGGAYAYTRRLVAERLEATRVLLRRLRRFDFEALQAEVEDGASEQGGAPLLGDHPHREDELDALLDETRRTAQTLAEKMQELRKVENYRREFIGNVSHELKTPIFSIQGFSETLLDGALEDESVRRAFVEKIERNAGRLRHLARDLAEIARIETGELKMTVTTFALRPLVQEVVESLEPAARAKEVSLQERLPEGLPPVEGDRERLRQVLTNLVDNAIKYNNEGGSVEVSARQVSGGTVKTYVVDDGIGVAPEHIARLTERFYRVDQSRSRSQGGTGLGLAIVKHILGAHGSELTVSSRPDHGSTFGFTLPAAPERGRACERGEKEKQESERGARPANGQQERQEKAVR